MTTNWVVKLTHRGQSLDLNSGRYQPTLNFNPPAVASSPLIADGTSKNRFGGGIKVSERHVNRPFTLEVYGRGNSDAEVSRAGTDFAQFLKRGSRSHPLFLEVNLNSDVSLEPLWGNYGANKRFQIVHASPPRVATEYARGNLRSIRGIFTSSLIVKPHTYGKEQELLTVTGGILEDNFVWKDQFSRGTIFAEAVTNIFTNPIFMHPTDWDNGWTTTGLTVSENKDRQYTLFGDSSIKISNNGATDAAIYVTNTLTVASYNVSCYAKRADGAAVSNADVEYTYDVTTGDFDTYTAVGDNGWYRCEKTFTAEASSKDVGVNVKKDALIYLDMLQLELGSFANIPCHGDMLGVAHTTPASPHTDTHVRTVAAASLEVKDENVYASQGCIRVAIKVNISSADMASDMTVFEENTSGFKFHWDNGNTRWEFTDGTNSLTSGASDTLSVGDVRVFHINWGENVGLEIFKEGASYDTGSTFEATDWGAELHIASTSGKSQHTNFTLLDFAVFPGKLTSAEISADYTNISKLTDDNQRIGYTPWFWTSNGDDIVENALDLVSTSTSSPHFNYAVAGAIPGTEKAITTIKGNLTSAHWGSDHVWLALMDVSEFFDPRETIYGDESATSNVAYAGGGYGTISGVDTTEGSWIAPFVQPSDYVYREHLAGREFYGFARFADAGSNLLIDWATQFGNALETRAGYRALTTSSSQEWYRLNSMILPQEDTLFSKYGTGANFGWTIYGKRSTGSADITFDFGQLLPRPLVYISTSDSAYAGTVTGFIYEGSESIIFNNSTNQIDERGVVTGDVIEFVPERTNILFNAIAKESGTHDIQDTLTYTWLKITPRYALL